MGPFGPSANHAEPMGVGVNVRLKCGWEPEMSILLRRGRTRVATLFG